jgi:hypothetical protein
MNAITIEKLRENHQVRIVTSAIRHVFSRQPKDHEEIIQWCSRLQAGMSLNDLFSEMRAELNPLTPHTITPNHHQKDSEKDYDSKRRRVVSADQRTPLESYFSNCHHSP